MQNKAPRIPPAKLPPYISAPEDKGHDLTKKVLRTISQYPGVGLCCGVVPDQKTLFRMARDFDGVLIMFKNITDEIVME